MPNKRNRIFREIFTGELQGSTNKSRLIKAKKMQVVYTYTKGMFGAKVISVVENERERRIIKPA